MSWAPKSDLLAEDEVVAVLSVPAMLQALTDALEVPEFLPPSEFAATHRHIKEGTSFRPGLWSNEVFPYLTHIMDLVYEAILLGKRGFVLMKSAQGGGSEGMINALTWLQVYYPGPILYLIAKEDVAKEFSRDRFDHINKTCPPLAKKVLTGYGTGESVLTKRYVDGKLKIAGLQSILNVESLPYPWVFIDEPDSMPLEFKNKGNPFKVAELRTEGWVGPTLVVAFSHPTTDLRGTGKRYYQMSDQRRGFVDCPHCKAEFWLNPEYIKVFPNEGQTTHAAERDPTCYHFVTPCCSVILTDQERISAVARRCEQKSTLPPEEAAKKDWIGAHFNQLYMSNKTMKQLATEIIQGLDDEPTQVVVVNKRWGDVYRGGLQATPLEGWKALRHDVDSPFAYTMGTVPAEVRYLTAGQDNGIRDLHWSVWGFGLVRAAGGHALECAWLIDCSVEDGPRIANPKATTLDAADLHVFDQVLYERFWPHETAGDLQLSQCYHDAGWQPSAVQSYCLSRMPRAVPSAGRNLNEEQSLSVPLVKWSAPLKWRAGKTERTHPEFKRADLNTYQLKLRLHGLAQRTFVDEHGVKRQRLNLPGDVPDVVLEHLASERIVREGNARVWKASGPNHWLDTAIMALGANDQIAKLVKEQTRSEAQSAEDERRRRKPPKKRGIRTRY